MVPRMFVGLVLASLAAVGCRATSAPATENASASAPASVTAARLVAADSEPGQWMAHGRTYGEQRFSPLDQINTGTVTNLGLAWFADLETRRGQESTPIVVDGVLYVTTAWSKVRAYSAATGALLWTYDPEVPGEWAVNACCDVVNRGVAVWEGTVFVGSFDGRLIALDAATGREIWDVNTIDRTKPYTITGAPRVVKGKVLIGNGGAEFGVRGYVSAYDAATGELAWRFYTVPGNPADGFENPAMKMAASTWSGQWWTLGGGGTVWDSMAYDHELDLLYVGVGNGSPWNHLLRSEGKGDNLFLASIVALDPDDGSYVWHYQTSPGETWDHTATQHIIVADLQLGGATRRVVMQAPKNGFFYVLDAKTGQLISAKTFTEISWATHVDMKTGRPVETPNARFYRTGQPFLSLQSPNGAHTWHPMSFSPQTGLVYIPVHRGNYTFAHDAAFAPSPLTTNLGIRRVGTAADAAARAASEATLATVSGRLVAWDPVQQREVWRVDREGAANGGVLSTAGGLVFQGTGTGEFMALNANTGARLWSAPTQTGVIAAPMSYALAGEQYVAVAVGTGGSWAMSGARTNAKGNSLPNVSRLLVYKLGGTAQLPAQAPRPARTLAPPPAAAAREVVARGEAEYRTYCGRCHGPDGAANYGILPDLRYSAALQSSQTWAAVVLGGALKANGMASFAPVVDAEEAEAIRAFVIAQANALRQGTN
ncbi:MAG: alcohol dehydrogenase [Acidobacteria bacterium RIFCSPLOWO2_12_FULL_67_14]|nr:MAG: alcohol dehydrogenase [Acidobacteria bacterium RIFCSPLOWO2_02_FULL_67_21]OFW38482.1 MAG: alcohol dehydrogenase [Acidobacteria bacterium RIFCSPLOWO2_12_FULL_67_14]